MNTKLEEEFNLAPSTSLEVIPEKEETSLATIAVYEELDKIQKGLPQVTGLDDSEKELDELAEYAITAHKDLLELAMNVEQRFCGEVSGASGNMLAHAITARTNKLKGRLDRIALQIKKQVADQKSKEDSNKIPLDGESVVMDRNQLLAELLKKP
jgi:hypothetical protein